MTYSEDLIHAESLFSYILSNTGLAGLILILMLAFSFFLFIFMIYDIFFRKNRESYWPVSLRISLCGMLVVIPLGTFGFSASLMEMMAVVSFSAGAVDPKELYSGFGASLSSIYLASFTLLVYVSCFSFGYIFLNFSKTAKTEND